MLVGKDYYAVDIFSILASVVDRFFEVEGQCKLTRTTVNYNKLCNKVVVDRRNAYRLVGELSALTSEIQKLKRAVKREFASYCPFSLSPFKFRLLDHLGDDLERFGSLSGLGAEHCERFNVLSITSYRTIS